MLSFSHTLISDLVVINLFMHLLPGMILLYLAAPFLHWRCFAWDITTFVRFIHWYRSRIIDSHIATLVKVYQMIRTSVSALSSIDNTTCTDFLNQACAGLLRPACAWFLKNDPVRIIGMCVCVCVCVCVSAPKAIIITSGVVWCDMNLIWLVKQVLQLLYGNYSRYR